MNLSQPGKNISEVEVANISAHGFWLYAHGTEHFLSYDDEATGFILSDNHGQTLDHRPTGEASEQITIAVGTGCRERFNPL